MRVERDELGLFIDAGYGSAIRPAGFSSLAEGSEIDAKHFGGSTLYGVGKLPGRGQYKEVWLSAPLPSARHSDGRLARDHDLDWEATMRHFLMDLGTFLKGNPDFDGLAASQNVEKLKAGRKKFMKSVGYSFGLLKIESELVALGKSQTDAQQAMHEAEKIKSSVHKPQGPAARRLSV